MKMESCDDGITGDGQMVKSLEGQTTFKLKKLLPKANKEPWRNFKFSFLHSKYIFFSYRLKVNTYRLSILDFTLASCLLYCHQQTTHLG